MGAVEGCDTNLPVMLETLVRPPLLNRALYASTGAAGLLLKKFESDFPRHRHHTASLSFLFKFYIKFGVVPTTLALGHFTKSIDSTVKVDDGGLGVKASIRQSATLAVRARQFPIVIAYKWSKNLILIVAAQASQSIP